jgi:uncharacterized protein (TIGR00661 family)
MQEVKIYLSDEGFGPLSRQKAIYDALGKMLPNLKGTIQLEQHYLHAHRIFPECQIQYKHNNIIWHKRPDGTPDLTAIRSYFDDYPARARHYLLEETKQPTPDFIVSDYVYEAFEYAAENRVPSFGVCHFTWAWFFEKLNANTISRSMLSQFHKQANMAELTFFTPWTPHEIIKKYGSRAVQAPFIVRSKEQKEYVHEIKKPKILLTSGGSGINDDVLNQLVNLFSNLLQFHFFVKSRLANIHQENITLIPENCAIAEYVPAVDLVITRAGFNTISECIAARTPMLLFGESGNPEMKHNISIASQLGLAATTSLVDLLYKPEQVLNDVFEFEYAALRRHMEAHQLPINGATVIAECIANRLTTRSKPNKFRCL